MTKKALIIGAGPAGLTAAYELLKQSDITPIIFEKTCDIGGISKTIDYKGNKIDIGGHRFFSKSEKIIRWWLNILPLTPSPASPEKNMLICKRKSHIFFLKKNFDYPLKFNLTTLLKLGFRRSIKILLKYLQSRINPRKPEKTLEDFLINRFGTELYKTFFKDYTKKVWRIDASEISSEWGTQRIKKLSLRKTILHFFKTKYSSKTVETSLTAEFFYPKLGCGQIWEETARIIKEHGGKIHLNHEIVSLQINSDKKINSIDVLNTSTREKTTHSADFIISSMPIKDLIAEITPQQDIQQYSDHLQYRNFISVGILTKNLNIAENKQDHWIYIQDNDVKMGRIIIYNNWSPAMVKDPSHFWIGLDYFCDENDNFWNKSNEQLIHLAIEESLLMNLFHQSDIIDSTIIRMPKAYPCYFGQGYEHFDDIKNFLSSISNLFVIGRNGMHKYNNQDHSMLTAMEAVNNIITKRIDKENIWNINSEEDYHEHKPTPTTS